MPLSQPGGGTPASHAASHANGGGDEVDATGLTGAGGGSTFVGCRAHRDSSAQTINDSTDTAIDFNDESGALDFDEGGLHSTGVNPSRFTANATGYWECSGQIAWDADATDARQVYWRRNGSTSFAPRNIPATAFVYQTATDTIHLTSGDYVQLMVYQGTGSSVQVLADEGTFAQIVFRGA